MHTRNNKTKKINFPRYSLIDTILVRKKTFRRSPSSSAALVAVNASGLLGHGALISTGVSNSARSQDAFGNYAFGYGIKDGLGAANSRSEVGDAYGNRKGSYTIADIDGRARRVDYVADAHGFRASVKTNEPGTAASAPAAALIASPYAGPVAPVVNHVAPAAPAVAAPSPLAPPQLSTGSSRTRSRSCPLPQLLLLHTEML
ncbi:adult-specific rigid cuticular protein 15.7 [Trichonephila inaurata madagascariensis]|uniref:Adult-specific rigid cuticular protein 15.7 n=1 Tax=Trichonephila inaurata madagascariensis TaxID=2747483 RepID=A0A8X6YQ62_9ARAC|nr:adult-specific rigid cuticular protein 15.7 [Trichonephila inaurata madagascariensis]